MPTNVRFFSFSTKDLKKDTVTLILSKASECLITRNGCFKGEVFLTRACALQLVHFLLHLLQLTARKTLRLWTCRKVEEDSAAAETEETPVESYFRRHIVSVLPCLLEQRKTCFSMLSFEQIRCISRRWVRFLCVKCKSAIQMCKKALPLCNFTLQRVKSKNTQIRWAIVLLESLVNKEVKILDALSTKHGVSCCWNSQAPTTSGFASPQQQRNFMWLQQGHTHKKSRNVWTHAHLWQSWSSPKLQPLALVLGNSCFVCGTTQASEACYVPKKVCS